MFPYYNVLCPKVYKLKVYKSLFCYLDKDDL